MRTRTTLVVCLTSLILAGPMHLARANDAAIALDIPAQSLGAALRQFAEQTGLQLVYETELAAGLHSPRVQGQLTTREALQKLLDGTGLQFQFLGERTVALSAKLTKTTSAAIPLSSARPLLSFAQAENRTSQDVSAPRMTEASDRPANTSDVDVLEEIVVTGSHLRGAEAAGSKVIIIGQEEIARSGYATVQDVVKTLPQNFSGGATEDFTTEVNFNDGTAVNLRGLGPDATLVLVNGRRQPIGGTTGQFVDISSIPTAAIERIEVLPDGASAIYGSDAIGGVVNIILRRDFNGAQTSARTGTLGGDADEVRASQLLGRSWSAGNVFLGYQYFQRDPLPRLARTYSADTDQRRSGGTNFSSTSSSPGNILDPATGRPAFAIPAGQDGRTLNPSDLQPGVTNLHNGAEGSDLLSWQRTHSAFAAFSQEIGAGLQVSADGRYSKRSIARQLRGFGTVVTVPSTNPFFVDPFGGRSSVNVAYNFLRDLGPVTGRGETETISVATGAKLNLGPAWQVSLSGGYGDEQTRWEGRNQANSRAIAAALADTNPATALNVFGDGGDNNPATLDAIRFLQTEGADSDVWTIGLVADGPLFEMPGGPARLAVGADYREEGLVTNAVSANPSDLGRDVSAAFAELALPLVGTGNARRGLRQLQLSLAARYERYSDFGDTFNPKVGLLWAPASAFKLRGAWGTSFKAPTLTDLNESTNADGLFPIPDPQSPTGFSPVLQRFGNNAALKEETADTWTIGFDLEPERWRNLRLSVSYFDIDYKDRIVQPGPPGLSGILLQEALWAAVITRNPSAAEVAAICSGPRFVFGNCATTPPVALVDFRLRNLAAVTLRGLDVTAEHAIDTSRGTIRFGLSGSYLLNYDQAVTTTAPAVDIVDTLNNPLALRLRGTLSWRRGGWDASTFINYAGAYDESVTAATRRIASSTTVDLSLAYRVPVDGWLDNVDLAATAVNVFDKDPPFANVPEGYDRANADPFGRMLAFQVTKGW